MNPTRATFFLVLPCPPSSKWVAGWVSRDLVESTCDRLASFQVVTSNCFSFNSIETGINSSPIMSLMARKRTTIHSPNTPSDVWGSNKGCPTEAILRHSIQCMSSTSASSFSLRSSWVFSSSSYSDKSRPRILAFSIYLLIKISRKKFPKRKLKKKSPPPPPPKKKKKMS